MQSDRDALLAGILADPDADLPRLVFADWLEETGHPANCARAEYIRLAIERVVRNRSVPQRYNRSERYKARLVALEGMFDDGWASFVETVPTTNPPRVACKRTRGFIAHLTAHAEFAGTQLWALFRSHPVVEFSIYGSPPAPDGLTEVHLPVTLRRLHFTHFRDGGSLLLETLRQADTPRLRSIMAGHCDLTDAHIIRLVQTLRSNPTLVGVESLNLGDNPLTDHAAHTLAAAELAPTFRYLNIDNTRITNAGREVLFRRFGFEELRPRLALS